LRTAAEWVDKAMATKKKARKPQATGDWKQ